MARELRVHGRSIAHIGQVLGVSASTVRRALLDPVRLNLADALRMASGAVAI